MHTKVAEFRGYTIFYDTRDRLFHLCDAEGEDEGTGKTQMEVEELARRVSKLRHKFPIDAFKVANLYVYSGRVTSLNPDDPSVRFVYTEDAGYSRIGTHTKEHIRYGSARIYEATEANKKVVMRIGELRSKTKALEAEIAELIKTLETPIDSKYFNLPVY